MKKPIKTIKKAIEDFDAATLKSAPSLQLELEMDIIIGGMKAVY